MKINTARFGLIAGPLSFLLILALVHPAEMSEEARRVLACTVWIAIWWITEAIPIAATSLLPIVLFPLVGALDVKSTAASFGHPYIFLYAGGFIIAIAIERWNLHRRIALNIINLIGADTRSATGRGWASRQTGNKKIVNAISNLLIVVLLFNVA